MTVGDKARFILLIIGCLVLLASAIVGFTMDQKTIKVGKPRSQAIIVVSMDEDGIQSACRAEVINREYQCVEILVPNE